MIDITTHRARIGTFNVFKQRKVKPKSNLEYGTNLNVLISIFMIITVMAAASQGLEGVAAPERTDLGEQRTGHFPRAGGSCSTREDEG